MTKQKFEGGSEDERILAELKARAAVDLEYRKRLLADPHQAITEIAGTAPPKELRIQFIEKPADVDVLAVLPDLAAKDQLSTADLEAVAGGDMCPVSCNASCDNGWTCDVTCAFSCLHTHNC
jgi:hypothetical protein